MQTNDVFSRTESSGPTLSPAIYNLAIGLTPVSYTHLTLPTISSV